MGKIREYKGEGIVVRYDLQRCIHAEECVHGLRAVFDRDRRPWIDATAAPPDEIAAVVATCPTGALSFERTDGGPQEVPADPGISLAVDGPLYVRGGVEIVDHEGRVVTTDARVALCRCGASKNKPFCDDSHYEIGFKSGEAESSTG